MTEKRYLEQHLYPKGKSLSQPDLMPNVLDSDDGVVDYNSPKRKTTYSTVVDLGDSPNSNNGDPLRIAFGKINNFIEASYWTNEGINQMLSRHDSELKEGMFIAADSETRTNVSFQERPVFQVSGTENQISTKLSGELAKTFIDAKDGSIVTHDVERIQLQFTPSIEVEQNGTFGGDLTVQGNLTVNGTTTTIDTTNLLVEDPVIVLAKNQATPSADIGQIFQRYSTPTPTNYNVSIHWDEQLDRFVFGSTTSANTSTNLSMVEEFVTISDSEMEVNVEFTINDTIANGMLFTNGSKFVKTDSRMTFDGTVMRLSNGAFEVHMDSDTMSGYGTIDGGTY